MRVNQLGLSHIADEQLAVELSVNDGDIFELAWNVLHANCRWNLISIRFRLILLSWKSIVLVENMMRKWNVEKVTTNYRVANEC